jgi:hypothetical protein
VSDIRLRVALLTILLSAALFLASCPRFGKISPDFGGDQQVSIEDLRDQWSEYNIHYATYPADYPIAIMFDPRMNDTIILTDGWIKMKDSQQLERIVERLEAQYVPKMFRILGPDGNFFGYLYSARNAAYIREVDKKTLRIFNLDIPSEDEIGP